MSQYFSLLLYSGPEDINLQSEEEQHLIVDAMHQFFMDGRTEGSRKLIEDFSANSQYEVFYEIFKKAKVLYECETYGTVRYVPNEEKFEFYEESKAFLVEYLQNVDSLLENGVGELEYLVSFINVLKRNFDDETHILFNIS